MRVADDREGDIQEGGKCRRTGGAARLFRIYWRPRNPVNHRTRPVAVATQPKHHQQQQQQQLT